MIHSRILESISRKNKPSTAGYVVTYCLKWPLYQKFQGSSIGSMVRVTSNYNLHMLFNSKLPMGKLSQISARSATYMKTKCHLLIFYGIDEFLVFLAFKIQRPRRPKLISMKSEQTFFT